MQNNKEYFTREKYDELHAELENLKTVKRKEVAESLEYAKSLGDLSENAEYQEARSAQASIEERIQKLEAILKDASIVDAKHSSSVDIGSVVVVRKGSEKDTVKYQIVGSEEADTKEGKISNRSPLGASMMGKKKGDTFSFTTPKGEMKYTVVDIE